jgi:hypothetical protein
MTKKSSPIRKYLLNKADENVSSKTIVNYKAILNECCCDYDETDDSGKIEMLKDVLLLLMKLVFGNDQVQISMGQGYIKE